MNICVLSGSPKGKGSVTFQTVRYLTKLFPEDTFRTIRAGQRIAALERDMTPALRCLEWADLVLFCYPVYTFLVPSQLHRFIELLKESDVDLSGKLCAQICTSKHFYDVTAMNFIRENALDMGLKYAGELSADMDDLLTERGRNEAVAFWNLVHFRADSDLAVKRLPSPAAAPAHYVPIGTDTEKCAGHEVVIVADLTGDDGELLAMIKDFQSLWPHPSKVVDLAEYPFAGGCLGCFHCASDGRCVYKDGFDEFLRTEIQTASATVYAFRIKDHSMGSRMKMYDDRQFCNGHRTVTRGQPVGYLIRGDLDSEPSLRMVIEGRAQVGGNFLAGTAMDAGGVRALVETLDYALSMHLEQPANFLGVGGMKIFRDLIWVMRGMMKADHSFYKEHRLYDFPQKQRGTILKMKLVGALLSSPGIRAKMGNKMTEGMLSPYEKLLKSDKSR